jgi:hypothetical protein
MVYKGTISFRVTPVFHYEVSVGKELQPFISKDKNTAMSRVAQLLDEGKAPTVEKVETLTQTVSELLAARNVQFRDGEDADWRDGKYLPELLYANALRFRVRPDHYWVVRVSQDAVVNSDLTFDDPVKLARYLNNYACSNNTASLSVTPRKYMP